MTSRTLQDYTESYFSTLRGMDGQGGDRLPTGLQLTYRIARSIILKISDDKFVSIHSLKDKLKIEPLMSEEVEKIKIVIPRNIKESTREAFIYLSGFVAFKMSSLEPSLGSYKHAPGPEQVPSEFLNLFNRGGLKHPSLKWLKDFRKITNLFDSFHPKNSLRKGRGVMFYFLELLKKEFGQYDHRILYLVTRMLTFFRLRTINKNAKKKVKKQSNCPITLRGRVKLAQYSS